MARRKKNPGRRRPTPAAPVAPPADAPPPDDAPSPAGSEAVAARLVALRAELIAGQTDRALAAIDAWLAELGVADGPEAADAPSPEPSPQSPQSPQSPPDEPAAPLDPVAAGLLQPFDRAGPRFSVLMAAYNRSALIGDAIGSVLAQGFADWELVIVDDGSTDATPEVVRGFAADEPRIRYIQKPSNEGRSPTRNRAVAEARGEFVLWMADDDLLAPDLLATYDGILRAEPHVDVIYGKLQLFEGDRDLDVYTPNDWTGRERRLLGAKLHGSCVPDGGTATRRSIYTRVGAPIYDPEFARAQDYELWTRLVPHARFRMVDRVVYRYRKHDGGTSWGPFVDLSYDSKIIRRHLSRHALEDLFTPLDWSDPPGARRAAMVQVGRLMLEYQDPHNAERFLGSVAAAGCDPDVIEPRIRGRLMAGDLAGAEALIEGFAARWPGDHPLLHRLRAAHAATVELERVGRAALAVGRPSEAETRAVAHHNRYGLGYHVALLRGLARVAGGDRREGLWFLCQAARLSPFEAEAAEQAAALAAELGIDGPRVDLAGMRRRLTEVFSTPAADPAPAASAATISAVLVVDGQPDAEVARALGSALAQSRAPEEILLVGAASPVDDHRVLAVAAADDARARRAAGLAAATGDYVAWLTADAAWTPDHLARLAGALDAGAVVAWSDGHRRDPETGETRYAPPIAVDRARLLADDLIPLWSLMQRRALMPRRGLAVEPVDGPFVDWAFALDLVWSLDREAELARVGAPTWVGPPPAEPPSAQDLDGQRALQRIFQRHPAGLLFAPSARARQAERLRPYGIDWPESGRTGVVVIGGDDPAAFEATLAAIEAHTRCPHAVVLVADGPGEATRAALRARAEGHTVVATPRRLGWAKAFNLGLSRAGGDRVAVLRAGVRPGDGWLGRLRWCVGQDAALGLALPATPDTAHLGGRVERPDDRCLLITRAALDAVGGADLTVDPALALDDWLLRLRQAGFGWQVSDVVVDGPLERRATPAADDAAPVFRARWGELPRGDRLPTLPDAALDRPPLLCPYGAEQGDRFDIPPVTVHDETDGAPPGPRILMQPPLDDPAARRRLLTILAGLPAAVRVWLRVAPGAGPAARETLTAESEPAAAVWIIDAPLAPDREGGLYTAADAVYVDRGWPDAPALIRRAFDCGHPPLCSPAALRTWAEANAR